MDQDQSPKNKKSNIPKYLFLGIITAAVLSYFLIPSVQEFFQEAWDVLSSDDEERIHIWVSQFGWSGPMVIILAMVLQMFLIVIPSIALMVVSVLAYGPVWGSVIAFSAVGVASSVGYWLGIFFGHRLVVKMVGEKTEKKMERYIEEYGFWAVVVTRLNPFLSNDAISFVGGMLRMGYWKFIGATLLGISPLIIFIAIMGESNERLKYGLFWGSIASLVGFVVYVVWTQRKKKKAEDETD